MPTKNNGPSNLTILLPETTNTSPNAENTSHHDQTVSIRSIQSHVYIRSNVVIKHDVSARLCAVPVDFPQPSSERQQRTILGIGRHVVFG